MANAAGFIWVRPPEVFITGMEQYRNDVEDAIFSKCIDYAVIIEDWMRRNAPWEDTCMPNREYLRAEAFWNHDTGEIGIRAWYDLELYRSQCGEPPYNWGERHERMNFSKAGVISIILPHPDAGGPTVLGEWADALWDEIQAMFA